MKEVDKVNLVSFDAVDEEVLDYIQKKRDRIVHATGREKGYIHLSDFANGTANSEMMQEE